MQPRRGIRTRLSSRWAAVNGLRLLVLAVGGRHHKAWICWAWLVGMSLLSTCTACVLHSSPPAAAAPMETEPEEAYRLGMQHGHLHRLTPAMAAARPSIDLQKPPASPAT